MALGFGCSCGSFLFGGTELFKHTVIDKIKEIFHIRVESESAFQCVGLRMEQHYNYITLDQIEYISKSDHYHCRMAVNERCIWDRIGVYKFACCSGTIELGCNPD